MITLSYPNEKITNFVKTHKWIWTFDENCSQDFIDLMKKQDPKPNFYPNYADLDSDGFGSWGGVSVWHDEDGVQRAGRRENENGGEIPFENGYINWIKDGKRGDNVITF